jgi:hypothetical protein
VDRVFSTIGRDAQVRVWAGRIAHEREPRKKVPYSAIVYDAHYLDWERQPTAGRLMLSRNGERSALEGQQKITLELSFGRHHLANNGMRSWS